MQCPRCDRDNPSHASFCSGCGEALPRRCPACGWVNPPDGRFCGGCGADVRAATEPARTRPLRAYTPSHLAERILGSRRSLEGERKQVTVLFADLKSSMEILAARDAEEARIVLDDVLAMMMEAVHRYEGTVNQILGDGIMALFGAPLAHEDHAVRACYAALAMQTAIGGQRERLHSTYGIEVKVRIGINSGDVVVRAIGNDLYMDYTAVGQTTHLASRMEQLAEPGTILVSADTMRLAEGYLDVQPRGPLAVKGLPGPVTAFELLGASPARTRWQKRATRGITRFVGRQVELAVLEEAHARVEAHHGQVVAVVGDPGVGKSRLVWEFTRSHYATRGLILETGSVPYGTATPWLPMLDLLKDYVGVESRDDAATVANKLAARLREINTDLVTLSSAFLGLLDVTPEDRAWTALDPVERRQRTLAALKRLLFRTSQTRPTVLIVEDLQWIDGESQALLDSLIEDLSSSRLLLLVTYRPEYRHQWAHLSHFVELAIVPLEPGSADELLHALLGGDPDLAPVRRLLIQHTEGNPFFIEEGVRSLAEAGILVGQRGAYRLAGALSAVQVPATVYAVLAARIDRLSPEQKRLLQTASVVGRDVPLSLLRAVAEAPEEALASDLARLQAAEFIHERQLFPEPDYTFNHALTHEVAYQGLLRDQQRALHARVVEAIETVYADRLPEHVDRLAHHAFFGEVWDKALVCSRQAGARAVARSAHSEAAVWFSRALEAIGHLPRPPELTEQAVDLHLLRANSLVPIAEFGPIIDHLREAERLARALGDQPRLGRVWSFLCAHAWLTGDHRLSVDHGQRALDVAERLDDRRLRVQTNLALGQAYHGLGDYGRAVDALERNVHELTGDLLGRRFGLVGVASVLSRVWLVWCLAELGEFDQALPRSEEAVRIAEVIDHPYSRLAAYFGTGCLYLRRGEIARAVAVLEPALALCQTWDTQLRLWFMGVAPSLGHAYALSGQASRAIPLLEEAIAQAAAIGSMFAQSLRVAWLAHAELMAGRPAKALRLAAEALELARRHHERGHEAWIHGIVGDIAAQAEGTDAAVAESAYHDEIAIAGELGMRPRIAMGHLGLGRLYRSTGERSHARENLDAAVALFRAMRMGLWLEQAEAERSILIDRAASA